VLQKQWQNSHLESIKGVQSFTSGNIHHFNDITLHFSFSWDFLFNQMLSKIWSIPPPTL